MINLNTNVGSVSDQKFFFDLDSDGEDENISFASEGSGFLALDKIMTAGLIMAPSFSKLAVGTLNHVDLAV